MINRNFCFFCVSGELKSLSLPRGFLPDYSSGDNAVTEGIVTTSNGQNYFSFFYHNNAFYSRKKTGLVLKKKRKKSILYPNTS